MSNFDQHHPPLSMGGGSPQKRFHHVLRFGQKPQKWCTPIASAVFFRIARFRSHGSPHVALLSIPKGKACAKCYQNNTDLHPNVAGCSKMSFSLGQAIPNTPISIHHVTQSVECTRHPETGQLSRIFPESNRGRFQRPPSDVDMSWKHVMEAESTCFIHYSYRICTKGFVQER